MTRPAIKKEYEDKLREDAEIASIIGANLRLIRESSKTPEGCDISHAWLGNLTALSRVTMWQFEKGKCGMTVATLVRLKEAFGCSWDDLLGGCESNIVKERKRFTGEIKRKKR
ncbi:MAG: helix-turn-helix domain-containing protein [Kiritimatiellaeota bacterium]|nr:helix-turn-helix domain-containing protein [Kiritimatiellota bacterium]